MLNQELKLSSYPKLRTGLAGTLNLNLLKPGTLAAILNPELRPKEPINPETSKYAKSRAKT